MSTFNRINDFNYKINTIYFHDKVNGISRISKKIEEIEEKDLLVGKEYLLKINGELINITLESILDVENLNNEYIFKDDKGKNKVLSVFDIRDGKVCSIVFDDISSPIDEHSIKIMCHHGSSINYIIKYSKDGDLDFVIR